MQNELKPSVDAVTLIGRGLPASLLSLRWAELLPGLLWQKECLSLALSQWGATKGRSGGPRRGGQRSARGQASSAASRRQLLALPP